MTQLTRRTALALAASTAASFAARAQSPAKLTYWHHFTAQEEFAGLQKVMALFHQRFPGVVLTQENIPNPEYMPKFIAAVMAKSRPDISMVYTERLPDMLAADGLVDITERVNGWKNKAFFPADRWLGATSKGKIWGVPAFAIVDWTYYRKDWFAEAGIAGPPATLDEFVAAAKKLTNPSKNRYGFGMRGGTGGAPIIVDIIESFGSKFVVDGKNAMDRDKTIAAIKWYSELATVHKVVPPSVTNDGFRQIMESFKAGQTAMTWHHTGSLVELIRGMKPEQFGTAAKPAGPAALVARLSYLYNGLMKKDNEQAAWDWISFWAEPDPSIAFLTETGYFPASTETAKDVRITGNPLFKPAVETLGFGSPVPAFPGYAGWSQTVVLPEFQKILVGQSTPAKATDAILKGLDAALD